MSELILIADAGDGTITTLRRDGEALTPVATSPVGPGVGTFAVDADRDLVLAGHKAPEGGSPGVATLRLDRATGALTQVAHADVPAAMTYLALTDDRRFLLGASYGGGVGLVWPVADDGSLGEPVARVEHPNLHCVVTSGDRVYFVSLGADLVDQQRIAPDGTLTPIADPLRLPTGVGARHLVLDGANAYLVTEYTAEVYHLTIGDDGALTRHNAVAVVDPSAHLEPSRLGADPKAEGLIWGADLHRAGRFLLASERNASTVASVVVGDDGALGIVAAIAPVPTQPRGFAVTPDGGYAVVVGEKSTDAALLRVEADGHLTQVATAPIGHGANWVRVVAD